MGVAVNAGAGDFAADTAVSGGSGRYRAVLSPEWEAWGPLGGYVAAIALRAMGAEAELRRPASFACAFLSVGRFAPVDLEVATLRRGRRSHALRVEMRQEGRPILAAQGWAVEEGMRGLEHDHARMPDVPSPEALRSYAEVVEDYAEWYRVWRTIDGKPVHWDPDFKAGPPVWRAWMRLLRTPPLEDPWLEAARSLMWLDLMMWNAAVPPHLPWPISHVAPNLDLAAVFHDAAPADEWLLCDADAPVGRDGIVGARGRVWSPGGRLLASATSALFCRPNPELGGAAE